MVIKEAQTIKDSADYTAASESARQKFDEALSKAQEVYQTTDADEDDIISAWTDLMDAIHGLVATKGDLDGDGEVTIADVMEACKVMARESAGTDPTDEEIERGDLDGDDEITIADVMEICKILARGA